ncbi:hypothetical protein, partial [Ligilactobacillus acidipiscis]|uniref:hypothetical protein n=1 Tax=Ligilactobacillus acidipiscis TaxID=89059 RepID=UPI001F1FC04C
VNQKSVPIQLRQQAAKHDLLSKSDSAQLLPGSLHLVIKKQTVSNTLFAFYLQVLIHCKCSCNLGSFAIAGSCAQLSP